VSGDERGPTPLSEPLAEVRAELGLPAPDAVARLRAAWPEVVGPDVAAHSRIRTLRDGTLTVAVDAPAWATTLRYQHADLVARAASACDGAVHDVRVVVDADPGR
jgi:predicted nucleic acid-binding Zn ribbon protein